MQKPFPVCYAFFARVHYNSLTVLSAFSSALFYCAALSNLIFHDIVYIQFRSTFSQKKFHVFLSALCSALFYCATFSLKLCTVPHCILCNSLCALYTLVCKFCVSVHCVLYSMHYVHCSVQCNCRLFCASARICRP